MYDKDDRQQLPLEAFTLPFDGKLSKNNRWIKLASKIDWDSVEDGYATHFADKGSKAIKSRLAFGALVIKELLGISDKEAVEQIRENPYLQYFCGYKGYKKKRPFSPNTMHAFRKRFPPDSYSKKTMKKLMEK